MSDLELTEAIRAAFVVVKGTAMLPVAEAIVEAAAPLIQAQVREHEGHAAAKLAKIEELLASPSPYPSRVLIEIRHIINDGWRP